MDDALTPLGIRNARAPTFTPNRRAVSAEPPSSRRSIRTPLDRSVSRDLLASIRRGTPGRNNAPTPHAKAARRALDQRRMAMFTPGKNRRRSLKEQRETPMGILRNLGRALAANSKPIVSSSPPPDKRRSSVAPIHEEDEDDELPIDRPRLSLPLDDDDDDSDLQPPRSSGLEEESYTVQSIELPRRAISEQPSRLSRGSFGSMRGSDFFMNMNNDPTEDLGRQSDFFPGLLEDIQAQEASDFTFERIDVDPARRTTMGRESDFALEMPAGLDDQTTFMMSEPGADATQTSAIVVEQSVIEATSNAAREPVGDGVVSDYDDDNGDAGGFPDFGAPQSEEDDEGEDEGGDEGEEDVGGFQHLGPPQSEVNDDEEDADMNEFDTHRSASEHKSNKKRNRVSRHGIEYPPLPPAFVKRVAQTALQSSGLSNSRISADTLEALTQASEWFFEQLGDDLGAYASHAKRKTVEESDVVTLMRRQRQIGGDSTMFSLAQRHLPRELLQELRMPLHQPTKQRRAKRSRQGGGDDEDEQQKATEVT